MEDSQIINAVLRKALADAEDMRQGAGYSGSYTDGGAGSLENAVKYYRLGQQGVIPEEWKKYAEQVKREADPEWLELQRLQKKFGMK